MKKKPTQYTIDVIVIGGGASGMMASIAAKDAGATVVVLEKNAVLGKKLRITGGGRCNITNATPIVRDLLSAYQESGKYLFSPFAQHGVTETRNWFATIGVLTVEEAERRVFPTSQSATAVTNALIAEMKRVKVLTRTNVTVTAIKKESAHFRIETLSGDCYIASKVILATGGTSHPETGSTGDGYRWLKQLGHTVVPPEARLVPLLVSQATKVSSVAGLSFPHIGIRVMVAGKSVLKRTGKVLFTHDGLSGPGILQSSYAVGEALQTERDVAVRLDFIPDIPDDVLMKQLIAMIMASPNRLVRTHIQQWLPATLVDYLLGVLDIPLRLPGHSLTVPMRRRLIEIMKNCDFPVMGLHDESRAVVSSGGVTLPEIDFRTMESRIIPGLYVTGDLLHINRPSGGYSLQLCWTTGMVAGRSAGRIPD